MRRSIRYKITGLMTLLIITIVLLCWGMNKGFLQSYYQYSKVKMLGNTYHSIENIYESVEKDTKQNKEAESIAEAKDLSLERLATNGNMNIYIFSSYYYTNYFGRPKVNLAIDYPVSQSIIDKQQEQLSERVAIYLLGKRDQASTMKNLKAEKKYGIYKIYDERIKSYYIELFGVLDNGYIIYLRSNFESLQESVGISNKFLAYVGVIGVLLGTILTMILSNSITKPIHLLSGIAKRMADLDFDAEYKVTTQDEIGELGTSINTLSKRLESTISELKSANNELKLDIERKTQIDDMRKEFLSNVTHELKTPIALIQGYAEGLQDNINEDEESKNFYCEVIIDEASKMNNMVKRLLNLNQLELGNNQVNIERFDIVSCIQGVLNSSNILIEKKGAKVDFQEVGPLYVWADEFMIEEVLTNYISNALNHLDYEKKIQINIQRLEECVRVFVYNTGDQIPEADLDKVWIKFYKVDKARTREYGGNGIGLSIVKAIMDAHNKECGVRNCEDGVEFWFDLDIKS